MPRRQRPPRRSFLARGFTLIELMIVVAIIGILAAVALPAYQDYIDTTNMTKVEAHYDEAVRFIRFTYSRYQSDLSLGVTGNPPPDDSTDWVAILNTSAGLAPGGTPAYVTGAGDADTGAVGINASGTMAALDAQVVVTRPAYSNLSTATTTLAFRDTI